jgi:hypothetical protein
MTEQEVHMKFTLLLLTLSFSLTAQAKLNTLNFLEPIKLKKVTMNHKLNTNLLSSFKGIYLEEKAIAKK